MSNSSPSASSPGLHAFLRFGLPIIGALLLATFFATGRHERSETTLRKYAAVPPFSLTERSGRTVTNHDLEGKIWVADFIFTTCPGPCPTISANMAQLQKRLAGDPRVQLVSFTVDPEDDTPDVLAAYANRFAADPRRWWFLTGPEKPVYDLIQNGFLQSVQDNHGKQLAPGEFLVTHSTYMVLVDAQGVLRGFYSGLDPDGQASLWDGIQQLENER
jgi:cytochrome oxidase Cu insertion factor (SCO1/SenC/PrrC family)